LQKVIIILVVFTITVGCSITRRQINTGLNDSVDSVPNALLNSVVEQNVARGSFFITKADVEVVSQKDRKVFVASIKFTLPDMYLISLKSKTGIEAARIYLTNDSVLINDRFNRILYYASTDKFFKKFGVNFEYASLFFGDYKDIKCLSDDTITFENDRINIKCRDNETELIYEIDSKRNKVVGLRLGHEHTQREILLSFKDFIRLNNILLPQRIDIIGIDNIELININIRKINLPWEGDIEFVPGNRYERIEIL
jgi:hypothetical protein